MRTTPTTPNIPQPKEILGYEVGSWHVSHDQLVNYMYRLAASSDRISIENRGRTYEDRSHSPAYDYQPQRIIKT